MVSSRSLFSQKSLLQMFDKFRNTPLDWDQLHCFFLEVKLTSSFLSVTTFFGKDQNEQVSMKSNIVEK